MKAMILAAGLGTRMRPLTLTTPKPLLPVNGVPLIEYHIQRLKDAGFDSIVINHAWLGEQIESALGDGSRFGVKINYSAESEPLETAGGIRKALDLLTDQGEQHFAVVNGDVFSNYTFGKLNSREQHLAANEGHLVLVPNPAHNPKGDFCLADGRLVDNATERYTFSGISVLPVAMFSDLAVDQAATLAPLLREFIGHGQMQGELHQGYWADIGTPERLAEIDNLVREQRIDGI